MDPSPLATHHNAPEWAFATWQVYSPKVRVYLTSTLVRVGGAIWVFDPISPPGGIEAWGEDAKLTGVILTNGNHERASLEWVERWSLPVYASNEAHLEFEPSLQEIVQPLPELPFTVIPLPGGGAGECAFFHEASNLLIVGDALIHLPETGFCLLPDKYCSDPALLRQSVQKLEALPLRTLAFAHGEPLAASHPTALAEKIAALLRSQ